MKKHFGTIARTLIAIAFLFPVLELKAQGNLQKKLSLEVNHQRLDNVLELISHKGDFYFSYNSQIFRRDSLVSFSVQQKTVKDILDLLFAGKLEYVESGRYIILKPRPVWVKIEVVPDESDRFIHVKGVVFDDVTGESLGYASVYDRKFLASALTNDMGYFSLRFKYKKAEARLYVSKDMYKDTSLYIPLYRNHRLSIPLSPVIPEAQMVTVSPQDYNRPDTIIVKVEIDPNARKYLSILSDSVKVEKSKFASLLLSSQQKIQSINLKNFFTTRPYQVSLLPGTSTQGKLSSQVVNNFSFNILGGYTGGVNGAEIGGLFNINKKSVRYVQVGGLVNLVGEGMEGFQIAGINNSVLDSVKGFQVGGISNFVGGAVSGVQVGGVTNFVRQSMKGVQVAGVWNHVGYESEGVQIGGVGNFNRLNSAGVQIAGVANANPLSYEGTQVAGVINVTGKTLTGTQVSGVFNYARNLKGVQVGVINIADSSSGIQVGLINFVVNGYHKLSVSTNETEAIQIALKTGHRKFYSMLIGGAYPQTHNRYYTFGYGIGAEGRIARWLSINPEATFQYVYQGSWEYYNMLNKFHTNIHFHITPWLSVFGGASASAYYTRQQVAGPGYKILDHNKFSTNYRIRDNLHGWIGWNAGIHLF